MKTLFYACSLSMLAFSASAQTTPRPASPVLAQDIQTKAALLGVDYSPDGKRLVTAGLGRDIVVYDAQTRQPVLTLKGHTDDVVAVKYSPNGRYIASGGVDKALILWDALTGEVLRKNTDHSDYVRDVAFSPNSKMLASAGWDGQALVFDTFSGQRLATLGTPNRPAGLTTTYDKSKTSKGRTTNMTSVAFNPSGTELLTASGDHTLRGFDTQTWQQKFILNGHTDEVWDARYSPNGTFVVSGAWDNTARMWDLRTLKPTYTIPAHVSDVWGTAFSPDGQLIATCGGDRKVRLWDVATGMLVQDVSGELHTAEVENVCFSPDGRNLASVSRDGSCKVWNVPGTEIRLDAYSAANMEKWARKGEFEKTDDFQKRIAKRTEREAAFRQEGREKMMTAYGNTANWQSFTMIGYNADTELFTVFSPLFATPFHIKVNPKEAEQFRNNFAEAKFGAPQFEFQNGSVMLKQAPVTIGADGSTRTYTLTL